MGDKVDIQVKLPNGKEMGVRASGWSDLLAQVAVILGNTVGNFIPWKCPYCGVWSRISSYGGNVVQAGANCPSCGRDIFSPTRNKPEVQPPPTAYDDVQEEEATKADASPDHRKFLKKHEALVKKMGNKEPQEQLLPAELIAHMLSFLPFSDLKSARRTCSDWYATAETPSIWKSLCRHAGIDLDAAGLTTLLEEYGSYQGVYLLMPLVHTHCGLYKNESSSDCEAWIRFYREDNLVLTVSTSPTGDDPSVLLRWLHKGSISKPHTSKGTWKVTGPFKIYFESTSSYGTVRYTVDARDPNLLLVDTHSLINQRKFEGREFQWIPITKQVEEWPDGECPDT